VRAASESGVAGVREYYDRHTAAFVGFGQGRRLGTIHRAVWAPGVVSRDAAFHYVDDRVADLIRSLAPDGPPHVVDLGCGVGASLCYLAQRLPMRGTGITLSPVQAELAGQRVRQARLSDRVACLAGDYSNLPDGLAPADVAFAIESFVHASNPASFFDQCRRLIRPGGLLAICDDFKRAAAGPAATTVIEEFRQGWHVNTLVTIDELNSLAQAAGFDHVSTTDLSPYLEIRRMRDRFIGALLWLTRHVRWARRRLEHLSGGHALQTCLARGWVGYDLAVFRRTRSRGLDPSELEHLSQVSRGQDRPRAAGRY
jgi:tocopherol O-methyltransferase